MIAQDILEKYQNDIEAKETARCFKAVFLTNDGQYVLGVMLTKLKFLEHCETERDMALNNFAKDLLGTIYWNEQAKKADTGKIMDFIKGLLKKRRTECRKK